MRGLFLKIFALFWIAQSLIFVISTALILRHRMPGPDVTFDVLSSTLRNTAQGSVAAFEAGGCAGLQASAHQLDIRLADQNGNFLCGAVAPFSPGVKGTEFPDHVIGRQVANQFVWSAPVTSASGRTYVFTLSRPHDPRGSRLPHVLHFALPQLPVAIAVGGVTTFVLVLLVTRPLARLRNAARQLAQGNLSTRIQATGSDARLLGDDEFQSLIRDFNHMAERLESLVDAQRLLLRDVSHELRSPLARVSVALELAREDTDPQMQTHLDRIGRETEKLNQLIGQLLTLSSMEAMELAVNFEPVSLKALLEQIIPDADYEAHQRQCSVSLDVEEDAIIRGNRELLYRALENVVRNAIRYTAAGSEVEIRVSGEEHTSGRAATVEVSDHGPGIPEAEVAAIFRPFYRVDRARSPETGGFGVGLAITERAVKLHGGELEAINRPGRGATIRIRFPAVATQPGERTPSGGRQVLRS